MRAGLADIPRIQTLARTIWNACYPGMISQAQIDYMLERMYAAATLAKELAAGIHYEFIVLERREVGYLALELPPPPAAATLHKLYLDPAWHGRGLGQATLKHALETARQAGLPRLELRVNRGNTRAIRAYSRGGFHITGSLCVDIGNGFVMDDHVMARSTR